MPEVSDSCEMSQSREHFIPCKAQVIWSGDSHFSSSNKISGFKLHGQPKSKRVYRHRKCIVWHSLAAVDNTEPWPTFFFISSLHYKRLIVQLCLLRYRVRLCWHCSFSLQHPAHPMDERPQEPEVSIRAPLPLWLSVFILLIFLKDRLFLLSSFDGIVLVTQSHESLPSELESLKAPLQDYSAVRVRLSSFDYIFACSCAKDGHRSWIKTIGLNK